MFIVYLKHEFRYTWFCNQDTTVYVLNDGIAKMDLICFAFQVRFMPYFDQDE